MNSGKLFLVRCWQETDYLVRAADVAGAKANMLDENCRIALHGMGKIHPETIKPVREATLQDLEQAVPTKPDVKA